MKHFIIFSITFHPFLASNTLLTNICLFYLMKYFSERNRHKVGRGEYDFLIGTSEFCSWPQMGNLSLTCMFKVLFFLLSSFWLVRGLHGIGQKDQWNKIDSLGIDSRMYENLICDKGDITHQWKKERLFNKWCQDLWVAI